MKSNLKKSLRVYAITDRTWLEGRTTAMVAELAIKGGATMIQYREKLLTGEELIKDAREVQAVCRKYNVPFILNDDPVLAKELDADGVHVGQGDMELSEARRLLGEDKIIGVTAKTVEQAQKAERGGADYLGSGAMFGSTTKLDAKKLSMEELKAITASVSIPVVAIGGITSENVTELSGTGIAGAAIVSGIFAASDIEAKAAEMLKLVEKTIRA